MIRQGCIIRLEVIISFYLGLFTSADLYAQHFEEVKRTPHHSAIRSMAAEIVFYSKHVPECAKVPIFYICNERHLHWNLGDVRIPAASLPMEARLQIEWFWKHLPHRARQFWIPYIREVDGEVDKFIRKSRSLDPEEIVNLQTEYRRSIQSIYMKGIRAYASATGTEPRATEQTEPPRPCSAAQPIAIYLSSNVKGVQAIKWIEAGTVWLAVSRTGREPEYRTYSPNTKVQVHPGATYYYKLVIRGRESKRLLAPVISTGNANRRIILAFLSRSKSISK